MRKIYQNAFHKAMFIVLFYLLSSSNCFTQARSDTSVTATFIGSAGYFLESQNKKVMVDAIFSDIVQNFGSAYPLEQAKENLINAENPYNSVDLLLFTHIHAGHAEPENIGFCLDNNPDAKLVTTQAVYDAMETSYGNFANIEQRIYVPNLNNYELFDTVVKDIPITLSKSAHWGQTEVLMFNFDIEGMNISYYLDYDTSRNDGEHYVRTDNIDLAFIDHHMLTDELDMVQNDFDFGHISLTHISDNVNQKPILWDFINQNNLSNVSLMTISMEKMKFTKSNSEILVDTLNQAPELVSPFPDTTAEVGSNLNIQIPQNSFIDYDNDPMVYTATLSDGSALPTWLNFDDVNLVFSGTPINSESIMIKLIAIDPDLGAAEDKFEININPSSIDKNTKSDLKIFPNPANKSVEIKLNDELSKAEQLQIFNLSSQLVSSEKISNRKSISLDLSHYQKGLYLVAIEKNGKYFRELLVLQ